MKAVQPSLRDELKIARLDPGFEKAGLKSMAATRPVTNSKLDLDLETLNSKRETTTLSAARADDVCRKHSADGDR